MDPRRTSGGAMMVDFPTECGPGWNQLIDDLDRDLRAIDPDYTILQIKDKFGSLRYYASASKPELSDLLGARIDRAEWLSVVTCENCGKAGQLRDLSWMRVLCDDCLGGQ